MGLLLALLISTAGSIAAGEQATPPPSAEVPAVAPGSLLGLNPNGSSLIAPGLGTAETLDPASTAARLQALEARVKELEAEKAQNSAAPPSSPSILAPQESTTEVYEEEESDKSLKAVWNHGLELHDKNKRFLVHVGGRTQYDNSFFSNDGALTVSPDIGGIGPQQDSFNFRRGRLRVEGTMYEIFDFAAEYDFVNTLAPASPNAGQPVVAVPGITDLWGTVKKVPILGNIRIGSMKEPIGMEHIQSSRFLPFIERSFLQDAVFGPFNNGFTPGVLAFDMREDERATWALGWFSSQNSIFGYGLGPESAVSGRLTWLPVYDAATEGRSLWHLGVSGSVRGADEGLARLRTRGNIRSGPPGVLNPIYADTGSMAASLLNYAALETAVNAGPLTLQAEWTGILVTDAQQPYGDPATAVDRGNPFFHGGYVQALWFLTGEHMNYSRPKAVFDRVIPNRNFLIVRSKKAELAGPGAWQVGVRYDAMDLNADGIDGGILHGYTFGVNWYWNPNMKIQMNYDLTHRSAVKEVPAGFINAWGIRYAMDF
jgi:phosphate-selective porin OprO/OprP